MMVSAAPGILGGQVSEGDASGATVMDVLITVTPQVGGPSLSGEGQAICRAR